MASWPAQADYRDALQNPGGVFRDAVLKTCDVERNKMRVPRARAGAFASVYRLTHADGQLALKLFNFPSPDREDRYRAVSEYVERLGAKRPSCLVGFKYDPQGIRHKSDWYPLQTMDWVKGLSLGEWVRQAAMERRDTAVIRKMADAWGKLVLELQAAKMAHGDLQHDNVMVVNDLPVLVDYDGICVPGLEGREQLEFGKPAYQHPRRGEQPLSLELDHFAAWIILIALRAIAADLGLYRQYVTAVENENLLFQPEDLSAPRKSKLWSTLLACSDAELRGWAKALFEACSGPFDRIPRFSLAPVDPFAKLRELAASGAKDWSAIADEAERLGQAGTSLPAEPVILGRLAQEARKRVAARNRLRQAVDDKNVRKIIEAYDAALLDDWPDAAPLVVRAKEARGQKDLLDRLKALAAAPGDGRALVEAWLAAALRLAGVVEADTYRKLAEDWRRKIETADRFVRLLASPTSGEQVLADAWEAVRQAGDPHPRLSPDHRLRGELALRRVVVLAVLRSIPSGEAEEIDRRLTAVWDERLLMGCSEAGPFALRVAAARKNLAAVEAVERAIAGAGAGAGVPESAIAAAAALLPAAYVYRHADRVRAVRDALKIYGNVSALVNASPPSDLKVAAAWEAFEKAHGAAAAQAPAAMIEACRLAVARRDALAEFSRIDKTAAGADRQDLVWLQTWRRHATLLRGRADMQRLKSRLDLAKRRYVAWQQLKAALDGNDLAAVHRLAENQDLVDYPPVVENRERIARLNDMAVQVERIQKNLRNPSKPVLAAEDLLFLRNNPDLMGIAVRNQIQRLVEAHLAQGGRLVPAQPPFQIVPGPYPMVKVLWGWTDVGIASHCLVAHDRNRHLATPAEADPYAMTECRPEDHQRGGGGALVSPPTGGGRLFVTVWPVADLGWTTLNGPPLHVGPIAMPTTAAPVRRR